MAQETDPEAAAGREPELAPARPESETPGPPPAPETNASQPETAGPPPEAPPALPDPAADEPEMVRNVLCTLLELMDARTKVELERRPDGYYANLKTRSTNGLLIGYRGSTMRSLQYVVRMIVKKHYPDVPTVTVDVSGYLARRENFLSKKATAVARIVVETRREMALDMLTEKEMETVEHALEAVPGVRVYALGTGMRRNVIIAPLQQ